MKYLFLVALVACNSKRDKHDEPIAKAPTLPFDEVALDNPPPGESDLSIDDVGHLWAVSERDHTAIEITLVGTKATYVVHPLVGVPEGVDTESLVWLGGGKFAIGTEGQDAPTAALLTGTLDAQGRIQTAPSVAFTNAQLGVTLTVNHGVEALCGDRDDLLAVIETAGTTASGARFSPVVRLHAGVVTGVQKLLLTSDTGKISAMTCAWKPDGSVAVTAIERHYRVSRIISFAVRDSPEIIPTIALDLWPIVRDVYKEKLNLEGIAVLPNGAWVLINDNQGAHVDGDTKLFVFHPR